MKRSTLKLASLVLLLGCVGQAKAGVIYDNGAPNNLNGNEMTEWIESEDFILGVGSTITGVNFWDSENPNSYKGSIHWQIYNENAGNPGTVLAEGDATAVRIDLGAVGPSEEFENSFNITPFAALPGVTYHLGLHNGPLTDQSFAGLFWDTTDANATPAGLELIAPFTGSWSATGQEHAFQLLGTAVVPEPSSLALFGIGIAGIAGYGWRRRERVAT